MLRHRVSHGRIKLGQTLSALQLFPLTLHNQMSHGTPEVSPTSAMQVNEQMWVEKKRTGQGRRKTPLSLTLVLAFLIPPFTLCQIISRLFTHGAHRTLPNVCLKSLPIFQQTISTLIAAVLQRDARHANDVPSIKVCLWGSA